METSEKLTEMEQRPSRSRLLGVALIAAAAIYCIPELQVALRSGIEYLTDEWRSWHDKTQR